MDRVLKLVDKVEESKVQKPLETTPGLIPIILISDEESDVEVIEALLVKKRKLTKAIEVVAPKDNAKNVASKCPSPLFFA